MILSIFRPGVTQILLTGIIAVLIILGLQPLIMALFNISAPEINVVCYILFVVMWGLIYGGYEYIKEIRKDSAD